MIRSAMIAATALLAVSTSSHAVTLFADDFNSNPVGLNGTPTGWSVSNGSVDIIGNGFFDFYPGNGAFLDMDGTTFDAGRIDTLATFNLVAGQDYTISFDYGKNGGAAETLNFGIGSGISTLLLPAGGIGSLLSLTFTFTAVATDTNVSLFFEALGNDQQGPVIDNVSLADAPVTPVPLPAALPLLFAGLAGLAALARRRKPRA